MKMGTVRKPDRNVKNPGAKGKRGQPESLSEIDSTKALY
jgi:hypothetical protein